MKHRLTNLKLKHRWFGILALFAIVGSMIFGVTPAEAAVSNFTATPSSINVQSTGNTANVTLSATIGGFERVIFYDVTGVTAPACPATSGGLGPPNNTTPTSRIIGNQVRLTAGTATDTTTFSTAQTGTRNLLACGFNATVVNTSLINSQPSTIVVNPPIVLTSSEPATVYGKPFNLVAAHTNLPNNTVLDFRVKRGSGAANDPGCGAAGTITSANGISAGTLTRSGTGTATLNILTDSTIFRNDSALQDYRVRVCSTFFNSAGIAQSVGEAVVNVSLGRTPTGTIATSPATPVTITATLSHPASESTSTNLFTSPPGQISFSFLGTSGAITPAPTCNEGNGPRNITSNTMTCTLPSLTETTKVTAVYSGANDLNFKGTSAETTTTTIEIPATLAVAATNNVTNPSFPTSLPPRGTASIAVTGGGPSFTYSVVGAGTLTTTGSSASRTNTYTAPSTSGTNTVRVVDSSATAQTATVDIVVGPGVSIVAAPTGSIAPAGTTNLTASGGSGVFSNLDAWTFPAGGNQSGASLSTATGGTTTYTAGTTNPSTVDTIQAKDTLGNTTTITISVGGAVAINGANPRVVVPSEEVTFSSVGGNGSYTYELTTNGSGSTTVGPSALAVNGTFAYKAGPGVLGSTSTDVLRVTDGVGQTFSINITVGQRLSIDPIGPVALAPNGPRVFTVGNGSTVFTGGQSLWSIATTTGATITSTDGSTTTYRAGLAGNTTDTITFRDSLGNTVSSTINVGPPLTSTVVPHDPILTPVPPRGQAFVTAVGGQAPYTYLLSSSASTGLAPASISADPLLPQTGQTNYTAGSNGSVEDRITITDTNNITIIVRIPVGPILVATPDPGATPPLGTLNFTATGGALGAVAPPTATGYTWTLTSAPSGGTVNATTGVYKAGTLGSVTDVLRVQDSIGNFQIINIGVGPVIVVSPAGAVVAPGGSTLFVAQGGNGVYTWALEGSAAGSTIDPTSGNYIAGPNGGTVDSIVVTDTLGNIARVTVSVTAKLAITPTTASVSPNETAQFSASFGSGTGYTFSLKSSESGGFVDSGGFYTAGKSAGTDVVRVTDSLGATADATVTVGPGLVVSPVTVSLAPLATQTFTATGGKAPYIFQLASNASGGSVDPSGGYKAGSKGDVTDTLRVTDATGAVVTATIRIGSALKITPVSGSTSTLGTLTFSATGGSGTGYTWSLSKNGSGGKVGTTGVYTAGATGPAVDTVTVTDSTGNKASANVSVGGGLAVTPPEATVPTRGTVSFSAVGGAGGYVWSLNGNASGGSIDSNTGAYVAGTTGNVTDLVTVTDATGGTATVSVTVTGSMLISPVTSSVGPGGKVGFGASGGSGSYSYSFVTNESGGTLDAASGAYVAGDKSGLDRIRVTDTLGNIADAVVTVTADGKPPTQLPDGGALPDASSFFDGGKVPDANVISSSVNVGGGSGGCSCDVVGGSSNGGPLGSLAAVGTAILGLALVARRRRPRN